MRIQPLLVHLLFSVVAVDSIKIQFNLSNDTKIDSTKEETKEIIKPDGNIIRTVTKTLSNFSQNLVYSGTHLITDFLSGHYKESEEEKDRGDGSEGKDRGNQLPPNIYQGFFKQFIDHSDESIGTFQQQYLYNDKFYKKGGPVLLWVVVGAPIVPQSLMVGSILKLASETNGLFVALEQRYFGSSYPVPDLSPQNLKLLTGYQTIEDTANFIRNVHLTPIPKDITSAQVDFVVVGGSCGGNTAAWTKQKYPDLIKAGWISSAPLHSELEFNNYDFTLKKSLTSQCDLAVTQVVEKIDRLLVESIQENSPAEELDIWKKKFGCNGLTNSEFVWGFAELLAYLNQYSTKVRPPTLDDLCLNLNLDNTVVENMQNMAQFFNQFYNASRMTCQDFGSRKQLLETKIDPRNVMRQNFFMMCNEFGQFQISNFQNSYSQALLHSSSDSKSNGVNLHFYRSKFLTLNYFQLTICKSAFNITTLPDVSLIEKTYGGKYNLNTSNLVFTTGDLDPWFNSTLYEPNLYDQNKMPVYVIEGGRHNSDLNTPTPQVDSERLTFVRNQVFKHIKGWLGIEAKQTE